MYAPGNEMQSLVRTIQWKHSDSRALSEDIIQEIELRLKEVNSKLKTNFNDISDVVKIADLIKTSKIYKKSFSEKIGEEEVKRILYLARLVFKEVFSSSKVAYAGSGSLVREALENMNAKVQNKTSLKYILFSGHDTNILSAMSFLNLPFFDAPYLSNLRFELFQDNDEQFFVKCFCMDKYMKIGSSEYCPFNEFKLIISNLIKEKST